MRRVLAMLMTAALLVAGGCGSKSYEVRLNKTLEDMRYAKRLNDNLMPAPTKGKLEELLIYVRPPQKLAETKTFMLGTPEPGQFDIETSFDEPGKQSMHILGRVKRPKVANAKTKKVEEPPANRGEFNQDVLALLNTYYGTQELTPDKFKEHKEKKNTFKRFIFSANNKNVQVYLYKADPYELAFIFEFPSAEQAALTSKISLCLESYATGPKARRAFSGSGTEEEGTEATGGATAF